MMKFMGVGVAVVAGAVLAGCGSSAVPLPATVSSPQVVNPASVDVEVTVTNTTPTATAAKCTVQAKDPSGSYSGFDFFTTDSIDPGDEETFSGSITITNEGAVWVTQATVECETTSE